MNNLGGHKRKNAANIKIGCSRGALTSSFFGVSLQNTLFNRPSKNAAKRGFKKLLAFLEKQIYISRRDILSRYYTSSCLSRMVIFGPLVFYLFGHPVFYLFNRPVSALCTQLQKIPADKTLVRFTTP